MRVTNFAATGLAEVNDYLADNNIDSLTEKELKNLLKTSNISFVAEGINRLQSTLLCELKDSYVQQSQRYVSFAKGSYTLAEFEDEDAKEAEKLIAKAFKLYQQMSQLKGEISPGRPQIKDYKYGIPIEDARYIFPLAVKTNVSIAMSADKLYDLFILFNDNSYSDLFKEFKVEVSKYLPEDLFNLLDQYNSASDNNNLVADFYQAKLGEISSENELVFFTALDNLDLKVGLGAATSTSALTPSEKLSKWDGMAEQRAKALAKRVLGYGHESIAEQARTTFGMICSMVTYHQQIRHRLPKNYREDLTELITDQKRDVVIPPRIKGSQFEEDFLAIVDEFKDFRSYLAKKYDLTKALYFVLNCEQIKFITATNARIDLEMLSERICLNAQWEIRELATKKLEVLRELSDVLYEKALPPCVYDKCNEGKLSCGKQKEMREKYKGS